MIKFLWLCAYIASFPVLFAAVMFLVGAFVVPLVTLNFWFFLLVIPAIPAVAGSAILVVRTLDGLTTS